MSATFKPSFLLVALSSATLGFGLGLPMPATAQGSAPELQFYPSKGWGLVKSDAACVLSTTFNNGFAMSLQGSEAWVEALAVDFQQDIFEKGQIYNVALNVPGVSKARFEGVARDASTISLNFKDSRKIYKAMRSTAVLDMNVENNDFRFYLTGFGNEAHSFERCMAGGGIEAKPDDAVRQAQLPSPETAMSDETPVALVDKKAKQLVSRVQDLNRVDSDSDFTANEAMAMEAEAKAKNAPPAIVEILPDDPKPIIQEIPVKETVKLKDEILEEKIVFNQEERVVRSTPETPEPKPQTAKADENTAPVMTDVDSPKAPQAVVTSVPVLDVQAPSVAVAAPVPAETAGQDMAAKTPKPQTREQLMAAAMLAEIRKNPDLVANGGGLIDLRQAPDQRVDVLSKKVAPEPKTVQVADVMLPDAQSTPPKALQTEDAPPREGVPPILPPLDTRDVTPVDAVQPNGQRDTPPKAPINVDRPAPVQIASTENRKTPAMHVKRERIEAQADFTQLEPAAAAQTDSRLSNRISDLERQLMALKRENEALNDDLKVTLREAEDERLSISSENWNLERATMRYNEAERQIKRLAQQLQKERAKHRAEIRELEAMLFDPQVTNDTQMARLADLETQLLETQEELRQQRMIYEERIQALEAQLSGQ